MFVHFLAMHSTYNPNRAKKTERKLYGRCDCTEPGINHFLMFFSLSLSPFLVSFSFHDHR